MESSGATLSSSVMISGSVHLDGTATVLSSGPKLKCAFQFNNPQYRGEQFVFDGKAVQVALIDQQCRSALGNFLVNEPEILQEGLFGGALSMGWPLLDVKGTGAKLKSEGLKKIDGRALYEMAYVPKKSGRNGELVVHFYFEPDSFHQVMSIYRLSTTSDAVEGDAQASGSTTRTTTATELFGDFRSVNGVTLPFSWEIRLRVEPGKTQEFQWKVSFTSIGHNKL